MLTFTEGLLLRELADELDSTNRKGAASALRSLLAAAKPVSVDAVLSDELVKRVADQLGFSWFETPDEHGQSFFSHNGACILNMFGMRRCLLLAVNPPTESTGEPNA